MVVHQLKLFKVILSAVVFVAFYELNLVTLLSVQTYRGVNPPSATMNMTHTVVEDTMPWVPIKEIPYENR